MSVGVLSSNPSLGPHISHFLTVYICLAAESIYFSFECTKLEVTCSVCGRHCHYAEWLYQLEKRWVFEFVMGHSS